MRLSAVFLAALIPVSLFAHEHEHELDLGNIGKAHLATSCNDVAQKQIDHADALLHSFWYVEAEKSFRRAADADPQCGMAWWGVAMANLHPVWAPPTPGELKAGLDAAQRAKETGAKTDRERAYIDAINSYYAVSDTLDHHARMVAYEKAMDAVAAANPNDHEAAIFHALALLGISDPKDKTYTNQKKAGEILNRVLPLEPQHPGIAHYIIHSFDYPELANLALPAARNYAKLAPGSPHALHMPSHIFTRLGLWDESIASNLASAEKARNYMARAMPGATAFDELHAVDYLVYAYLQRGQDEKAHALRDRLSEISKVDNPNNPGAAYALTAVPARYAIERRQWKEAAALTLPGANVAWEKFPYAEANVHFAIALGAARSNQPEIAQRAIDRLDAIHHALVEKNDHYWADQVEIQRLGAAAWLTHDLKLMRAAADLEASTEKHPVTPGSIVPARELLSEMLLDAGKPEESLAEAEHALRDAPNRYNGLSLAAQAAERAGKVDEAKKYRAKIAELRKGAIVTITTISRP